VKNQDKCVEVWLKVNTESGNCGNGKPNSHKHCGCKHDHCQHDKPKESEKPKNCDKPKESAKPKSCDKPKNCDKPKESEKSKSCNKPKETGKPKSCDKAKKCPGYLTKDFQFPHLIIPVDSAKPSKAYTTSFNGTVSNTISTIFNFDMPASFENKRCSADFLFPEQSQLETSAFTLTGSGEVEFSDLYGSVTQGTTWSSMPKTHETFPTVKLAPGNAYRVWEGPCSAGKTISIKMKAKGDTCLNYFQDFNPCPIGLYINTL